MGDHGGCESYAHRYAKKTVRDWFLEKWDFNQEHGYRNTYYIFDWEATYQHRERGVRLEYPILSRKLADDTMEVFGIEPAWGDYPDLEQAKEKGNIVNAILDIAIISNNRLKYGIEIVYKHPTPPIKRKFLSQQGIEVYEINALWVLNQIRKPAKLEMTKLT
jgi:hypothetical protein